METSSKTSTQLSKVTCPVCCDRFKTPKVLPCGHTFCQPCTQQLFQSTPISCPVCRVQVSTPYSSVDQLPTNYVLKAIVDSDVSLFDKEFLCRSFDKCPTHKDVCDQFCRTCEKQVCKQCINEYHHGSPHDISPVGAVVIQQREVLDNLTSELGDLMKRLELIGSNITESKMTCQAEADRLGEEINASVAESTDSIASNADSLQAVVQEDKKEILEYLDDLKIQYSEIFLSASYALDLCQSLHIDLDKSNLSRVAVMKRLNKNRRKIKKDLEKLEGKKNVLHIGLKFQSLATEAKTGKLASKTSPIVLAIPMKTISFGNEEETRKESNSDPSGSSAPTREWQLPAPTIQTSQKTPVMNFKFSSAPKPVLTFSETLPAATAIKTQTGIHDYETDGSLLAFLWPTPTWMIAVRVKAAGSHSFLKFTNRHFLRETFHHEIGVDQKWSFVSHSDYGGKFILCLCPRKVHKFSLPSNQNLKGPGEIVSTVFTPGDILGVAWDKVHTGCFALLDDGKTLLHAEFTGPEGFKKVAVFDEEITNSGETHFFHVNEEGSMAICDNEKRVVHFFEKTEAQPSLTVRAPPNLQNPTPECINTRRGEKLWYVMWKFQSKTGYVVKLYAYDSSFQLIDSVPNLKIKVTSDASRVMFCFQRDYVAVTIDDRVEVYALC